MHISAPAKLNLCLDIISRHPSGYHEIETIFCEHPALSDELEIKETQQKDDLKIANPPPNHPPTPPIQKEDNLAFRALKLLKEELKITKNASIFLKKNIPISSGLGGASSDAAAVLKGLNELWGLSLTTAQLMHLAAKLGADVPFFILCPLRSSTQGPPNCIAHATGFGEKLTQLPSISLNFTIHPKEGPENKTARAYAQLDLAQTGQNRALTKEALEAIAANNPQKLLKCLHNDFETLPQYRHLATPQKSPQYQLLATPQKSPQYQLLATAQKSPQYHHLTTHPKPLHLTGAGPSSFTAQIENGPRSRVA